MEISEFKYRLENLKKSLGIVKLKEDLIPWVTDKLVSNGTKIYSIEPHNTTLEDVFLTETEENK